MRNKNFFLFPLFVAASQFIFTCSFAQPGNKTATIVYDISITKHRHAGGIEETYNGGTKAIFITGKKARIRLVTLMRIQSMFFDYTETGVKKVTILKESGKKKYTFNLTPAEWNSYNYKYDSTNVSCSFTNDSLNIAGYTCKKVVINLQKGRQVIAYYTDSIQTKTGFIEPLFRCVPGMVLQYEFFSKKGFIIFKAAKVSNSFISTSIFTVPSKGFAVKKYRPGNGKNNGEPESEDPAAEE